MFYKNPLSLCFLICLVSNCPVKAQNQGWSKPKPLFRDSSRTLFNINLFNDNNSTLTLLGNTAAYPWEVKQEPVPYYSEGEDLLDVTTLKGASLEKPEGDFTFSHVRGIRDKKGTFHLVWAEPDSFMNHSKKIPSFPKLYYANMKNGRWSPPQKIFQTRDITFENSQSSRLVEDNAGRLYLAIITEDSTGETNLVHLVRDKNHNWKAKKLTSISSYAISSDDMVLIPPSTLVVAFIGLKPKDTTHNNVFVIRSTDDGQTWSKPMLVSKSTTKLANHPKLLVSPEGTLHLLFDKNFNGKFGAMDLWHFVSDDNGKNWHKAKGFKTSPRLFVSGHSAMIDSFGVIHLAYGKLDREHHAFDIKYTHYKNGSWSKPILLAEAPNFGDQTSFYEATNKLLYLFYVKITKSNKKLYVRPFYKTKKLGK